MRLLTSGFFHESIPYSPRIHDLKHFWILFRIRGNIRFWMLFRGVWYPAGLCSAGSDTPQDFVKQGIRPRRTLFCGVSDPAEQVYAIKSTQICHCSAGSDTPQDLVLRGLIPRRVLFCGVWYPARLSSAGSDTPQGLVLRGLITRRILFCGVSDPTGKLRPRRTRQKCF
jgi:hypothetical protein